MRTGHFRKNSSLILTNDALSLFFYSAVLSSMVLKEKLSLTGKIGCALCIVGAVIIVFYAPGKHLQL